MCQKNSKLRIAVVNFNRRLMFVPAQVQQRRALVEELRQLLDLFRISKARENACKGILVWLALRIYSLFR